MVLLVPDDSELEDDFLESDDSGQPKAQLDDSEASRATQKVDLDLDDAPFLEDEDDEEEEIEFQEEEETPLLEEPDESSGFDFKALLKNKLVLIFAGVVLILIAVIIFLLLREPDTPPPPPPPPVEEPVQEQEVAPPVVEEDPEILIRLDPFLIEQRDKDDNIRFLEVRVVVSTQDDGLARQFKQETYTVRNAVYYYLKNKDLQFLSDKENSEKLKKELLAIINQYMGFGQFDTLLFEQYLVRLTMGSTPLDLPVLISQMGYVAKIVHAEKAKPEVERQIFGPLLDEQIREKEGKVQQVDKKQQTDPVDRDGKQSEQQAQSQRERKEKEPDDDPETGSSNPSPWSGNIVNVKI